MEPLTFFLAMDPPTITQQMHRVGKRKDGSVFFYESQKLAEARKAIRAKLYPFRPAVPFESAVRLVVKWCFPKGRHRQGEYKTSRPDADNLQKMLKDEMTKLGFWRDDALVASEIVEKFWAEPTGIYVDIRRIEE